MLQRFVHGTLESIESCSFDSPFKKSGMKTFAVMTKRPISSVAREVL